MLNANFSRIRRLSQLGTLFSTWLNGEEVGHDSSGNRYFRARRAKRGKRDQRWVIYNGEPEASAVPPEWHIWLHHIALSPLPEQGKFRQDWQKQRSRNSAGTAAYEAWEPKR